MNKQNAPVAPTTSASVQQSGSGGLMINTLPNHSVSLITMSSREIADLVESRHDSVKRTIERLAKKQVIPLTPTVNALIINWLGKKQKVAKYQFCKRDSSTNYRCIH